MLGDLATHPLFVAETMAPQLNIKRLMCSRQSFVPSRAPLEDNAFVLMEYDNGAVGSMWTSAVNSGAMHSQKVRIVGENASIEWWDEHPNQLSYEVQGEPARILERGMPYLSPNALADDRIGGGHPEGLFEAWANLYRRYAQAIDATDRDDRAFLQDFWYPDVEAGLHGVYWVEQCVKSADAGSQWVDFSLPWFSPSPVSPPPLVLLFYQHRIAHRCPVISVKQTFIYASYPPPLHWLRFYIEVVMNDNKMTPGELRATWGLGTVFSLRMLGMFMVLPVLTTYGMALQGASEALIGLAIGIYGLAQAVFQIPFGLLSDRIGRKPLIVGGLLIFVLGSVIAALTDSIWGIILGRALQGSGAIAAAVMALLSISPANRTAPKRWPLSASASASPSPSPWCWGRLSPTSWVCTRCSG